MWKQRVVYGHHCIGQQTIYIDFMYLIYMFFSSPLLLCGSNEWFMVTIAQPLKGKRNERRHRGPPFSTYCEFSLGSRDLKMESCVLPTKVCSASGINYMHHVSCPGLVCVALIIWFWASDVMWLFLVWGEWKYQKVACLPCGPLPLVIKAPCWAQNTKSRFLVQYFYVGSTTGLWSAVGRKRNEKAKLSPSQIAAHLAYSVIIWYTRAG